MRQYQVKLGSKVVINYNEFNFEEMLLEEIEDLFYKLINTIDQNEKNIFDKQHAYHVKSGNLKTKGIVPKLEKELLDISNRENSLKSQKLVHARISFELDLLKEPIKLKEKATGKYFYLSDEKDLVNYLKDGYSLLSNRELYRKRMPLLKLYKNREKREKVMKNVIYLNKAKIV